MAEYEEEEDDELPSVDHGPLNEGPWEKTYSERINDCHYLCRHVLKVNM